MITLCFAKRKYLPDDTRYSQFRKAATVANLQLLHLYNSTSKTYSVSYLTFKNTHETHFFWETNFKIFVVKEAEKAVKLLWRFMKQERKRNPMMAKSFFGRKTKIIWFIGVIFKHFTIEKYGFFLNQSPNADMQVILQPPLEWRTLSIYEYYLEKLVQL